MRGGSGFTYEQKHITGFLPERHRCAHRSRGGGLKPARADWVITNGASRDLHTDYAVAYLYYGTPYFYGGNQPDDADTDTVTARWQGTDPTVDGTPYTFSVRNTRSLNAQMPSAYVSYGNSTSTATAENKLVIGGVGGNYGSLKAIAVDSEQATPPTPIPFYSATTTKVVGGIYGPNGPNTPLQSFSFQATLTNTYEITRWPRVAGTSDSGYSYALRNDATASASTFSIEQ